MKCECQMFCLVSSIVIFLFIFIHGHYVQASNSINVHSMASQLGNQFKVNNLSNLLKSVGFEMNLNKEGLHLSFGQNNKNPSSQHGNQEFFPLNLNNLPPHKIIPPSGSMPGFVMIPLPPQTVKNDVSQNVVDSTTTEVTTATTNLGVLKESNTVSRAPIKGNKANRLIKSKNW